MQACAVSAVKPESIEMHPRYRLSLKHFKMKTFPSQSSLHLGALFSEQIMMSLATEGEIRRISEINAARSRYVCVCLCVCGVVV